MNAKSLIKALGLQPLPEEGGYFREVYRAKGKIPGHVLPNHSDDRSYGTSIYYLITPEEFSGFHRVKSDEIFHFYMGDPVKMVQIDSEGCLSEVVLGADITKGQVLQTVVPAGIWQGTKLVEGGSWTLMGCTVAPGFEFADFEGGTFEKLLRDFPQHREVIRQYTHR